MKLVKSAIPTPFNYLTWLCTAFLWSLSLWSVWAISLPASAQGTQYSGHKIASALPAGFELFSEESSSSVDTWIHMQGSNTVGAKLTPAIAVAFLESKGIQGVEVITGRDPYDKYIKGYDSASGSYVQIRIESYGSGTGFKGLVKGSADIAASSRPIKKKEIEKLASLGGMTSRNAEHVVGIDGLAIIVHPSNPVKTLTVEQIAKLFSGKITNWSQVGGLDMPVNVHARDHESGTWDTFKGLVLAKKYKLIETATRYVSNDELSTVVSETQGAIGFTGLSSVGNSKLIAVADGVGSPAMYPTRLTVGTEDYPLARRLFLYTSPSHRKPIVDEFLRFALGHPGQRLVDRIGYISLNIETYKLKVSERLPSYYREAVSGAERLSMNFRFKEGKAGLDNKAFADIERLVNYLARPENKNRSIVLIGSSDPRMKDKFAVLLSKLRAKVVRKELIKSGVSRSRIKSVANGALLQVAGNDSLTQRIKNRRVEVWLQ